MRGIRGDSKHEHETKWKGNAGLGGTAWEQREEEKWRESEGNETKQNVQSKEIK